METIFNLSNFFVLPFWLLVIFLPHWRWTQRILRTHWPVVILALVYALLLTTQIGAGAASLLNPTLAGIASLLGTEAGAMVAWVHFLAFDLFVGRWAYLDSREQEFSAWWVSPTLFFTLMAGPLGLLLYLLGRGLTLRWRSRG
jgi:hypothetical protein